MSDERILVLSPLDGGHTPDAMKIKADCGHQCWISKTSIQAVLATPMKTRCIKCAGITPQSLAELGQQGGAGLVPGQREELEDLIGKPATDAFIAKYNLREGL